MASKAVVSLQVPAGKQNGELPLLTSRAQPEHPWNRRRFPKESLQISVPEAKELTAYPAEAVKVHNTFIHVASPRPSSERVVQSCPSSHIGRLRDIFDDTTSGPQVLCLADVLFQPVPSTPEPWQASGYVSPEKLSQAHYEWQAAGPQIGLPMPGNPEMNIMNCLRMPPLQVGGYPQQMVQPQSVQMAMQQVLPDVLMAESMLPPSDPAPGSAELPSMGSKEHGTGECKPCAFLHVKGCDSGAMCKFCHLCDAGEKKRRQKAKKAAFRGGA